MSKEDLFAAKYPGSAVSEKLIDLYNEIRGTSTASTNTSIPDIWPTWIRTEDTGSEIGVTVNFITNHPIAQETRPDIPVPIEQKVSIYGEEAGFINDHLSNFMTSDTVTGVQDTMKNIILYNWASGREHINNTSVYRTIGPNGALVDTFYNPYVSTDSYGGWLDQETASERFRRELKMKQAPMVIRSHRTNNLARSQLNGANFQNVSPQEVLALHLLRKMITPQAFKNYLRRGIVSVTGQSGLVYAIVRQNHLVEVYRKGKLLSTLCVYLKDKNMPPTDEVVAKMVIVQCDEHDIWKRANINWRGVPDNVMSKINRHNFRKEDLTHLAVA